jgi:hypothetical protein
MNPFEEHIAEYSLDDPSSVYSRSPESPKPVLKLMPIILPIRHDLPEINTLDQQIALARGSTMALETTRSRLRGSKTRHRLSLSEMKEEKIRQRDQQEHENEFYRTCFKSLHQLVTVVIESIQELVLQYHFVSVIGFRAFLSCPDYINTPFEVGTKTLARILFIRQLMSFDKSL